MPFLPVSLVASIVVVSVFSNVRTGRANSFALLQTWQQNRVVNAVLDSRAFRAQDVPDASLSPRGRDAGSSPMANERVVAVLGGDVQRTGSSKTAGRLL